MNIEVVVANESHKQYIPDILSAIYEASQVKGNSIVMRDPDYLAQKIKDSARENNISIVENKPLARSLYNNVEIGDMVPPELYLAVAEVLASVYKAEGRV